jgi:hypothetical protein
MLQQQFGLLNPAMPGAWTATRIIVSLLPIPGIVKYVDLEG